jgi:di/tricarboxylate transporter
MTDVKDAAREAEDSTAVDWLARIGLASRGIVWLVVGLLALQVALGDNKQADRNGALRAIADKPFGEALLVVLVVGFLGYAAWRLLEGAVGHRDEDEESKRWAKRIASLARGGVYLFLAGSTAKFLVSQNSADKTKPLTARVMSEPGGRALVLVIGVGLVIGGIVMGVRAVRQKFEDLIDGWKLPDGLRPVMKVVGTFGLASRGFVFALIGGFLIAAAIRFKPDEAKGLDDSLKTLADQPYGQVLLFVAALGLLAFAVWSFIEARYRKL